MELSSALFTRVASGISKGQTIWALLTLNEYDVDDHLRAALLSRAAPAMSSLPLASRTKDALASGKRLGEFSLKQQGELKVLMQAHRPRELSSHRLVPSPSLNAALVRNRTSSVRQPLVAHA